MSNKKIISLGMKGVRPFNQGWFKDYGFQKGHVYGIQSTEDYKDAMVFNNLAEAVYQKTELEKICMNETWNDFSIHPADLYFIHITRKNRYGVETSMYLDPNNSPILYGVGDFKPQTFESKAEALYVLDTMKDMYMNAKWRGQDWRDTVINPIEWALEDYRKKYHELKNTTVKFHDRS
jgi:hypothetical protein